MFIAALKGHVECLQLLLQHNTDPNLATTGNGTTPLHAAAGSGGLSAAQLLVVHGASIAAAAFSGDAPSVHAARNVRICVVGQIVKYSRKNYNRFFFFLGGIFSSAARFVH